jgi:hypothetical protein
MVDTEESGHARKKGQCKEKVRKGISTHNQYGNYSTWVMFSFGKR